MMREKIATIRKAAESLLADSDALDSDIVESGGIGIAVTGEVPREDDVIMMDS